MTGYDRLSALFARFSLSVTIEAPGAGNLVVLGRRSAAPKVVIFFPHGRRPELEAEDAILLDMQADLGGAGNPLLAALPERLSLSAADDDQTEHLMRLLLAESAAERCGFGSVLSRLAEVLLIRLLRSEIEKGATEPGLLAALADRRISRSIVAIHGEPERGWRNDELATIAGMSPSRFAEVFRSRLNETPQAYLRRWRMTLARQDIRHGDRIKAISQRYGYQSSEAFAKAFHRHFGCNPLDVRRAAHRPMRASKRDHPGALR